MTESGFVTCSILQERRSPFLGVGLDSILDRDRMLALAIVKCIEIVGEAAGGISQESRERFDNVPWADIVGMRHRLVHAYFDIDLDRVWDTITDDLPPLIAELERIVPPMNED